MTKFLKTYLPQIARISLGVVFCVSGINFVYQIFPIDYSPEGASFIENLKSFGYVWPALKITELLCGLMLIFGYFGPLALFILAPITLGIVLFHVLLSPGLDAILGYSAFALEVFLIFYFRRHFTHIFKDFFKDVEKDKVV